MFDFFKKFLNPGLSTSGKFKIDLTDVIKLTKTGMFVGASAGIAYVIANMAGVDFDGQDNDSGINGIMIVIFTVGFEALQKYLTSFKEEKKVILDELEKDLKEDPVKFSEEIKELKSK